MAKSGIKASDGALKAAEALSNKKREYVIFTFAKEGNKIELVVHDEVEFKKSQNEADDYENFPLVYKELCGKLEAEFLKKPCYILLDAKKKSDDARLMQKMVFITWCPEGSAAKDKMLMASSSADLKAIMCSSAKALSCYGLDDIELANVLQAAGL